MSLLSHLLKRAEELVNDVVEVLTEAIQTGGNEASQAAENAAAAVSQDVPVVGAPLAAAIAWIGREGAAVLDSAATAIKGIGAVTNGMVDLVGGITAGAVTGDVELVKDSAIGVVTNTVGGVLIAVGGIVSLFQTTFGLQSRKVALTQHEFDLLVLIFRKSLDTTNIRIVKGRTGSGVYKFTDRPFTMGNIIYMKDAYGEIATLVHECVHVWQYQHYGSRYSADALGAMVLLGMKRAYEWWKEPKPWTAFNAEAQAMIFEHMYDEGEIHQPPSPWVKGDGNFVKGDAVTPNRFMFTADVATSDYTDLGNESTAYVRNH